jgi:hypothetical protein
MSPDGLTSGPTDAGTVVGPVAADDEPPGAVAPVDGELFVVVVDDELLFEEPHAPSTTSAPTARAGTTTARRIGAPWVEDGWRIETNPTVGAGREAQTSVRVIER